MTSTATPKRTTNRPRPGTKRAESLDSASRPTRRYPRVRLTGKVIVITGGFGLLGRVVAEKARSIGIRIVLVDRGDAPEGIDADLVLPGIDLMAPDDVKRAFTEIGHVFTHVNALLNIAGAFEWHLVASDLDAWERLYRANVLTAINACRATLPLMMAGSAIVNVAAAAATRAGRGMGPYTAAKSGVLRLTESLAEELKPRRIRVNAVSPTIIDTPRNRADMPTEDFSTWVQPEELARVMLFLVSSEAKSLTGANVLVGA